MIMFVVCLVSGVHPGSAGDPSECGSVDPLHQSAAGNTGHEPARVARADSQVDQRSHTYAFKNPAGSPLEGQHR